MKWSFIDTCLLDKKIFGFKDKIFACKVAKWNGKSDVRGFQLQGWQTYAEISDVDPVTVKRLKKSKWFIYAAKGQ